jgi:hypothetical protein
MAVPQSALFLLIIFLEPLRHSCFLLGNHHETIPTFPEGTCFSIHHFRASFCADRSVDKYCRRWPGFDLRAERVFACAKPVPVISFATQFIQEAILSASGTRSVRGIRRFGCFFWQMVRLTLSRQGLKAHHVKARAGGPGKLLCGNHQCVAKRQEEISQPRSGWFHCGSSAS